MCEGEVTLVFQRSKRQPLLVRGDIPGIDGCFDDPSAVFNPGAALLDGRTFLMLRVQARSRETFLVPAWSDDGIDFDVEARVIRPRGLDTRALGVHHVYDPRLTHIENHWYALVSMDTDRGCRLALLGSTDLREFDFLGIVSRDDRRNGVLFPERVGGDFVRLDRPNVPAGPGEPPSGNGVWLSRSDDLIEWTPVAPVFRGRNRLWDERIGAGPPPILTRHGWLLIYHGVATHFASVNIYQAGVVLLDREDPSRVIARSRHNVLEPRTPWESTGQVPNVVFPSGLVVDGGNAPGEPVPDEAKLRLYYGAADTCIGLATTTVERLISACHD